MNLLITGATGFIGQALVSLLADNPSLALTILVREEYAAADGRPLPPLLATLRPRLDVVYADLRNRPQTMRALRAANPAVVIHLAAAGVRDPFLPINTALRHNLQGTLNLIDACFTGSSVQQLVVGRTPGELTSMNVYAASKAAAWNFCEMYGRTRRWPIHGAMLFQAYGPQQSPHNFIPAAIRAALSGQDFPMTHGVQERDWIYISDVAAGLAAMIGADLPPAATIELGSGQAVSLKRVAQMVFQLTGSSGQPRPGKLPDRPGEPSVQVADAAASRRLIGWETAVSLEGGLQKMITALQDVQF